MNLNVVLSASFFPLLEHRERYIVLCGGRGSGKSEAACRILCVRGFREHANDLPLHRFLVMRKVRKTLGESVIKVILTYLDQNEIPYEYNKSERTIRVFGPLGIFEFIFEGLDDPEKLKSIKAITSVWIEEATEFSRDDFLKVDLCLREPGPGPKQIYLTFNPQEVEAPWLKEMFFGAVPHRDTFVHRSTVEDNPIAEVRNAYLPILEDLRSKDEALWKIARLGEWAARTGQIFSWDVQDLPRGVKFDDVFLGGDFGYSIDPAALARIYRKADDFWVEELIYETGLTNQDLAGRMTEVGVQKNEISYWDSAEPKSIEELKRLGWKALPAMKGPDSVRSGIDFLKSKRIHIVTGSVNLVKEHNGYCWRKDRGGTPMAEPVAFDDHLMSAVRYGIFTRCSRPRPRVWSATWGG